MTSEVTKLVFWFVETCMSIVAIVLGTYGAVAGGVNNVKGQIAGFSVLTFAGLVGLIISVIYGNTGPSLVSLFKYPFLLLWWLLVLFGCTFALVYGALEIYGERDEVLRQLKQNNAMVLNVLVISGLSIGLLLTLTLMFRSTINISKILLFR